MSQSADANADPTGITARQVRDYLTRHPDFFCNEPDLLQQFEIPHRTGAHASLIERQVAVLRERNDQYRRRLDELITLARSNDRLLERLHALSVNLMAAASLDDLLSALLSELRDQFAADELAVILRDIRPSLSRPEVRNAPDNAAEILLGLHLQKGPRCGELRGEQRRWLFGDKAERVASAAVVPLGAHGRHGVLAIGSHQRSHFSGRPDTLFLTRLGELITARMASFADATGTGAAPAPAQ